MITNISDRKDTKFLLYNNTLSVEIKFHWQIIAFFLQKSERPFHEGQHAVSLIARGRFFKNPTIDSYDN